MFPYRTMVTLLPFGLLFLVSIKAPAEDEVQSDLLGAVRAGLIVRQTQLSHSRFTVKRTFGPETGALDVVKFRMAFMKAAAAAGRFELPQLPGSITDKDEPSPVLLKKSEYWLGLNSGDRLALYYSELKAPELDSGWTFRSFFNGDHWEQFLNKTSLGPVVRILPKTDAPPVRAFLGLDQPALLSPDWASFIHLLTRGGSVWELDSCQLLAAPNDASHLVQIRHHVPVSANVRVPMLMTSLWDLDKDGAPIELQVRFGTTVDNRVQPIKIQQGKRVIWTDYRRVDAKAWIAGKMEIEKLDSSYTVLPNGDVAFEEKDGVRIKGLDGFPIVDDARNDTREFIVDRETWDLIDARMESDSGAIEAAETYPAGTIVQNELGSELEVYQLVAVSGAVTSTMRKMLHERLLDKPPVRSYTFYDIAVTNIAVLALMLLLFLARRFVLSRKG